MLENHHHPNLQRLHFEQLTEDKVFFGNLDKGPLDLNDKLDLNVTRCIYVLKDWKVSNYFEALLLLVEL